MKAMPKFLSQDAELFELPIYCFMTRHNFFLTSTGHVILHHSKLNQTKLKTISQTSLNRFGSQSFCDALSQNKSLVLLEVPCTELLCIIQYHYPR